MGSHTVALDMSQVHVLHDEAGAQFVAVTSTREQLQAAPAFERDAITTSAETPTPVPPGAMAAAPGVVRPDFVREASSRWTMPPSPRRRSRAPASMT